MSDLSAFLIWSIPTLKNAWVSVNVGKGRQIIICTLQTSEDGWLSASVVSSRANFAFVSSQANRFDWAKTFGLVLS